MTLEELKAHIAEHNAKYGTPQSDDFEDEEEEDDFENDFDEEEAELRELEQDSASVCAIPDPPPIPQRSTGPRTPEGKAVSSQNANKHGCCSKTLILPHEDAAEYEALRQGWLDQYQPSGQAAETLVQQLIDNHWFLLRNTKRMEQVDYELPANPCSWTAEQQKLFNNFNRYKTAAERAFQKSFNMVETLFRDRERAKMDALKADLLRAKIEAQIARKPKPAPTPAPAKRMPFPELALRIERNIPFNQPLTPENLEELKIFQSSFFTESGRLPYES